ncbi:Uncharacterised protein [Bordetella pertussis]|nr:Uncharacterised protein [Bordetella pertussis]
MSPTRAGTSRPKLRTFKACRLSTMATANGSSRLTMARRAGLRMRALACA